MNNEPVRPLIFSGLSTLSALAPRSHRMTPAGGTAFAASMRMVNRVHRNTAHTRTDTLPAAAACLADHFVLVIGVGNSPNRRHAFAAYDTHFAGAHFNLHIAGILTYQLRISTCSAGNLAALTRFHLYI